MTKKEHKLKTVFLVAFFKFDSAGPEWGFERIDLHHIFKTEDDARKYMNFSDEAGWYEGVLIEERPLGGTNLFKGKRIWFVLEGESLKEIEEPKSYKGCVNFI